MSAGDGLHDQVTQTRVSGSMSFKQHSLSLYSTVAAMGFMIWDVTGGPGAGGAGGCLVWEPLLRFNILMEALLALVRPYGQTRTEELSSWEFFNRGKTYLVPSILTVFKQLFN